MFSRRQWALVRPAEYSDGKRRMARLYGGSLRDVMVIKNRAAAGYDGG
jgi:hypothetical protein